jgi:anti-anti-sigma factor
MNEHALTIKTSRDGPVCVLTVSGDLDLSQADGFLQQAARAIHSRTERLVLDLAGVTFLDCAGARALAIATRFVPRGCPVVVRSLSPVTCRILALVGLDLERLAELSPASNPPAGQRHAAVSLQELVPAEPGSPDING